MSLHAILYCVVFRFYYVVCAACKLLYINTFFGLCLFSLDHVGPIADRQREMGTLTDKLGRMGERER